MANITFTQCIEAAVTTLKEALALEYARNDKYSRRFHSQAEIQGKITRAEQLIKFGSVVLEP